MCFHSELLNFSLIADVRMHARWYGHERKYVKHQIVWKTPIIPLKKSDRFEVIACITFWNEMCFTDRAIVWNWIHCDSVSWLVKSWCNDSDGMRDPHDAINRYYVWLKCWTLLDDLQTNRWIGTDQFNLLYSVLNATQITLATWIISQNLWAFILLDKYLLFFISTLSTMIFHVRWIRYSKNRTRELSGRTESLFRLFVLRPPSVDVRGWLNAVPFGSYVVGIELPILFSSILFFSSRYS